MRIAVVGVGGVGGYFGGRLAQAGHEVHFIARGAHLEALRSSGLRIESIAGNFTISPAHTTDDPATVGPVEIVLVGVKTWQLADAARLMRPLVGPETGVVPLLNGVEAPDLLAAELGAQHALVGLCRIVAFIGEPGLIRHTGIEPYIAFGERDNRLSPRIERLRDAFAAAGVAVEVPTDTLVALWAKFLLICTWSGLGSLTRMPIGTWRSLPETRRVAEQVLREVIAVGRARGVALDEGFVARSMAFLDSVQAGGTASMQRDIADGRPSELESQTGAVVRLGRELGVPTPVNELIYAALLPQELQARG